MKTWKAVCDRHNCSHHRERTLFHEIQQERKHELHNNLQSLSFRLLICPAFIIFSIASVFIYDKITLPLSLCMAK